MRDTPTSLQMAQGFSLIEALITALVISIGLLGVAGLQLSAKQANYEAMQRTTAALLAEDMISRLRANSGELAYFVGKEVTGTTITTEPSPACSPSSPCSTAEQLAAHDLWEWEQLLIGATEQLFGTTDNTGGLVEPTGCITGPASGDHGAYTVTIAWRGVAAGSNPSASTCGQNVARYGTDNAYRRLVSMTVYITPLAGGL